MSQSALVSQGAITNAQRIEAAIPTIRYAVDNGAKVRACVCGAVVCASPLV